MTTHSGTIRPENLGALVALLAAVGETAEHIPDLTPQALPEAASGETLTLALGRLNAELVREDTGGVTLRVEAPHGYGRAVDALLRACRDYTLEGRAGEP